jgi:prepilin signal peptidase PulO-like enzyme (type II secretory pathway)
MVKLLELKTSRPDDLSQVIGKLLGARGAVNSIVFHAMTGFMRRTVQSSLFNARTYVTVVEVVTEIVIAITAISFATILLSLTMVVPVIITPVVAAPIVIVVIAAVVEAVAIITGRVSTIAAIASVSSIIAWIGTRSSVVNNAVAPASRCA